MIVYSNVRVANIRKMSLSPKNSDWCSAARMSALGQKQTFALQNVMSALPSKADMCGAMAHVRYGPKADILASNPRGWVQQNHLAPVYAQSSRPPLKDLDLIWPHQRSADLQPPYTDLDF